MNQNYFEKSSEELEEKEIISTKVGISIILTFGISLTLESIVFIIVGGFVTQMVGVQVIPVNLVTITLALLGAAMATYYYHTRYVKRQIILNSNGFTLKIGKRSFNYKWVDFSLIALSVSYSHYGAKGFIIKLYVDDLEGEYVDLPLYRFPKSINVFELRDKIIEKVNQSQIQAKTN